MPLSNQKKEELKKEFANMSFIVNNENCFILNGVYSEHVEPIANYWLTIIDSLIDEKVKEIEKEKQEWIEPKNESQKKFNLLVDGRNAGLDTAIDILKE